MDSLRKSCPLCSRPTYVRMNRRAQHGRIFCPGCGWEDNMLQKDNEILREVDENSSGASLVPNRIHILKGGVRIARQSRN